MKVKFLMIAEINNVADADEAQNVLDSFRESTKPLDNYGILLYRVRADDLAFYNDPDILRNGIAIEE